MLDVFGQPPPSGRRPTLDDLAYRNNPPTSLVSNATTRTLKGATGASFFVGFLALVASTSGMAAVFGVTLTVLVGVGGVLMMGAGILLAVLGSKTDWFESFSRPQSHSAVGLLAAAGLGALPTAWVVALVVIYVVVIAICIAVFAALIVFALLR